MSKLKKSNILMLSLILMSITLIISLGVDHSSTASLISSNNPTNIISGQNSLLDQSITTNKILDKKNSVLASNKISTVKESNSLVTTETQIILGTQIYNNGVPVARGTHPAGYAYPTIGAAITDAQAGDTIMLESGKVFHEHININKNLNFDVLNKGTATIDGNNIGGIVTINSGLKVTFNNITFMHGTVTEDNKGGAITNTGTLSLTNCVFQNNIAHNGGAIYNTGTLFMINCSFVSNTAYYVGGAIWNSGTLTITNSSFTSNSAPTPNLNLISGGAIYNTGKLNITNCSFSNNTGRYQGGAIWNSGTLIITNSFFNSNSVPNTIAICEGGAIYSATGTLYVFGTSFTSNSAGAGGAISTYNTINLTNCIFTSNTVKTTNSGYGGGAIAFGNSGKQPTGILTVNNSNFSSNLAAYGGTIYNSGISSIIGCNFLNNSATVSGDSIYNTKTLTLNFNRIIGTGNAITSPSGSVNAKINWWGSNSSPSGKVSGNVDASAWLVLTTNATPSSITTKGTSNITADITHDQNGVYYIPANGHVPDGIPISFTRTLGTVNPDTTTINNGDASTTFTATTPSTANITATVDGCLNTTNVSIGAVSNVDLTLWVYDMNGLKNWFYQYFQNT